MKLKSSENKRMELLRMKQKDEGEIERLKQLVVKQRGDIIGYRQSSYDDLKKAKDYDEKNKELRQIIQDFEEKLKE